MNTFIIIRKSCQLFGKVCWGKYSRYLYYRSSLRVFGGSSHPELAARVARKVGVRPGELKLQKFANKETSVQIMENVRGESIYIIQSGGGR